MIINYPDLEGKKILITGATRGIGKSIAEHLASQKAHVIFNYRSAPETAQQFANHLKELGASDSHALEFDITDSNKIKESITNFTKEFGPISGLVNNAGISKDQIVLRLKEEDIAQTLDTNLKGSILVASHLARGFLKAENVSVVNISSVVGLMGNASQIAYSASKAGLLGLTKSFAKELASRNVRCNAICPGFIETEMTQNLEEKARDSYLENIPLQRFGSTEEVSNLVLFLLSQASSYITGEIIKIDGGLYI
jgi:3-oxoacyl-[acyl-carrier protein] reductase